MTSIKEFSSQVMDEFKAVKFVGFKQAFLGIDKNDLSELKNEVTNGWQSTPLDLDDVGASRMDTADNLDLIADRFGHEKLNKIINDNHYLPTNLYIATITNTEMDINDDDEVLDPSNHEARERAQKILEQLDAKQLEIMNSGAPLYKVNDDNHMIDIADILEAEPTTPKDAQNIIDQLANQ